MDIIQTILDIESLLAPVGPKDYKHASKQLYQYASPGCMEELNTLIGTMSDFFFFSKSCLLFCGLRICFVL